MKKKLLIASILLALCLLPLCLSGCFATLAYKIVVVENSYDDFSTFENIEINTLTADVSIRISSNGKNSVACSELKGFEHNVSVTDNTLVITQPEADKWYEKAYTLTRSSIVIFLNENKFDTLTINGKNGSVYSHSVLTFNNVSIHLNSGNVEWDSDVLNNFTVEVKKGNVKLEDATLNLAKIEAETGDVEALNCSISNQIILDINTGDVFINECDLNCSNATIKTGYVNFSNVIAKSQIFVSVESGGIYFTSCDASHIDAIVKYGNIKASFLSGKKINANAPDGNIDIPENSDGGDCNLSTNTGSIKVEIIPREE